MLLLIVFFLAWLSFIPQTLQARYLPIVEFYILGLLFISLCKHRFNLRDYFFKKNDIFIWIYFFLMSVGLINATNRNQALGYYVYLVVMGGGIYFLFRNFINSDNIIILSKALVIFACMVGAIGLLEMVTSKNIFHGIIHEYYYKKFILEKRIMSTLENPAILGHYLLTCAPFSYYFYKIEKDRFKKRLYLIYSVIVALALIMTFSRAAIIGGIVILCAYLWMQRKRKVILMIFGALISASFLVLLLPKDCYVIRYRFGIIYILDYIFNSHRTIHYLVSLNMFKEHPFFGIGLLQYRESFSQYASVSLPFIIRVPESSYLMHIAETGIFGFSGFIFMLVWLFNKGRMLIKGGSSSIFLFVFLSFIGFIFNMGTYDALLWHTPFYLFWILAGTISALKDQVCNGYLPRT